MRLGSGGVPAWGVWGVWGVCGRVVVVLLAAGVAGPVGLAACALGVLFGLTRVSALGVPYLRDAIFPEVPLSPDGVTRRSYPKLSWRPFTIWQKRGG